MKVTRQVQAAGVLGAVGGVDLDIKAEAVAQRPCSLHVQWESSCPRREPTAI